MSFYQSISENYRKIFPLNRMQIGFVSGSLSGSREISLLDIGCGTGDLSLELSKLFQNVVGIDLDATMLEQAIRDAAHKDNLHFFPLNMLDIEKRFGSNAFDSVICFGNTLVHLNSVETISSFLNQAVNILKPGGKLLIQIINYDRILELNVDHLPTIENNEIKFERNYHYSESRHLIEFETILTIKENDQVITNSIGLYPVRRTEIELLLKDAGFITSAFFGSFNRESLSAGSIPMIIEAAL